MTSATIVRSSSIVKTIEISRSHALSHDAARAKAEDIARQMGEKYGIVWRWEEQTIHFSGSGKSSGVGGYLQVGEKDFTIKVILPHMLGGLFGPTIKRHIEEYLDQLEKA